MTDESQIVNEFMDLLNKSISENRPQGRPQIFTTALERKLFHRAKYTKMKYSTHYYNNNKKRIKCPYCEKTITGLTAYKHQQSKKCKVFQDYFNILQNL
jgi:nitrous oxidase accessory protein NosD